MPTYYYEYAVPAEEMERLTPEERRERRTDPSLYTVRRSGTIYSQTEAAADLEIKDLIADGFPAYAEYGHGVMMFTEVPEDMTSPERQDVFSDADWEERLERANANPDDTIIITEEERRDL